MKNDPNKIILTVEQLRADAHTSDLGEEKTVDKEQMSKLKDARARREEEWSLLANQVVGAESGIFPAHKVEFFAENTELAKTTDPDEPSSLCRGN